jgi:bacterioferritin-associated ferredoxin
MYICLCNALTDRHVLDAVHAGARRPSEVYQACACAAQCGTCSPVVRRMVDEAAPRQRTPDLLAAD